MWFNDYDKETFEKDLMKINFSKYSNFYFENRIDSFEEINSSNCNNPLLNLLQNQIFEQNTLLLNFFTQIKTTFPYKTKLVEFSNFSEFFLNSEYSYFINFCINNEKNNFSFDFLLFRNISLYLRFFKFMKCFHKILNITINEDESYSIDEEYILIPLEDLTPFQEYFETSFKEIIRITKKKIKGLNEFNQFIPLFHKISFLIDNYLNFNTKKLNFISDEKFPKEKYFSDKILKQNSMIDFQEEKQKQEEIKENKELIINSTKQKIEENKLELVNTIYDNLIKTYAKEGKKISDPSKKKKKSSIKSFEKIDKTNSGNSISTELSLSNINNKESLKTDPFKRKSRKSLKMTLQMMLNKGNFEKISKKSTIDLDRISMITREKEETLRNLRQLKDSPNLLENNPNSVLSHYINEILGNSNNKNKNLIFNDENYEDSDSEEEEIEDEEEELINEKIEEKLDKIKLDFKTDILDLLNANVNEELMEYLTKTDRNSCKPFLKMKKGYSVGESINKNPLIRKKTKLSNEGGEDFTSSVMRGRAISGCNLKKKEKNKTITFNANDFITLDANTLINEKLIYESTKEQPLNEIKDDELFGKFIFSCIFFLNNRIYCFFSYKNCMYLLICKNFKY